VKIVIAGGGTAGWLSALFISKILPEHSVTLIENSQIGIIGTGEGSTGLLRAVIKNKIFNFGCDEKEFIKQTGSFPKLGIKFTDWGKPLIISPIDGSIMQNEPIDTVSLHAVANNIPAHLVSEQGHRIDLNKMPYADLKLTAFGGTAYHFDGHKVGQYFKSLCNRVTVIDDTIQDIVRDDAGNVIKLILKNQTLDCDFIIDSLGFNSVISKKIDKGWISFKKHLPVNTAIPFQLKNTDLFNTSLTTESKALNYGWMWKIPVADRYGCGYVFDNNHISSDQAIQEIETLLGEPINPIKVINFESGRQQHLWKHNVVSIGLSGGFLEPLQATAIHTVIAQLQLLCFNFLIDKESILNVGCQQMYNKKAGMLYDDFADFINLHYHCGREDTEFWKYMKYESRTENVATILEIAKSRLLNPVDFNLYKNAAGNSLWNPIIAEFQLLSPVRAQELLNFYSRKLNVDHTKTIDIIREDIISQPCITIKQFLEEFNPSILEKYGS
jgi:tryptophan halogenase